VIFRYEEHFDNLRHYDDWNSRFFEKKQPVYGCRIHLLFVDQQLENRLRFLRKANTAQMPHSDRALFDHLLGTRLPFSSELPR